VDVLLHEFVSALEELSGEDNDGGGTISDFSVLDLGKLDENLGAGWVTSSCLRIVAPSLVMVTSPMSSTSILSRP